MAQAADASDATVQAAAASEISCAATNAHAMTSRAGPINLFIAINLRTFISFSPRSRPAARPDGSTTTTLSWFTPDSLHPEPECKVKRKVSGSDAAHKTLPQNELRRVSIFRRGCAEAVEDHTMVFVGRFPAKFVEGLERTPYFSKVGETALELFEPV